MQTEFISMLRCPVTRQRLLLEEATSRNGRIEHGWLTSSNGEQRYPIRDFIPRFVPPSNYADNFGLQWNKFAKTQLDSHVGHPISADRFWKATGWRPEQLHGRWVLDVGCGAGRFAEVALLAGAKVVAVDYSSAVNACYSNLNQHPNLHVVQGDIYALPFENESFAFIYSLGVLQHTPDVRKAFSCLPPLLKKGGGVCVDLYWKRFRSLVHSKYLWRPLTTRVPKKRLFEFLERFVPLLLPLSRVASRIPIGGIVIKRLIPVADYSGVYPLNTHQLREWALLDTFDMLAPTYDSPQTAHSIRQWLMEEGLVKIEVFQAGHLVGRASKPT